MKILKISLTLCVYLIGTLSVSLNVQADISPELLRSSVVVSPKAEFVPSKLQTYSWAENHADVSAEFKKSKFSVAELIDKAIINALNKKSYKYKSAKSEKMLIQYHVLQASEMSNTALTIKYGLSPGLQGNSDEAKARERGVLIVDIIDSEIKKVVWRGAVEVFIGLEDTQVGRQQRVNGILLELFIGIPSSKVSTQK
ncbi:hypothetical protein MNBD_GAMMA08-3072 [hydrothermal vent metagenome]|uniref:DUF4136 domain-containing protein n=1 Tax=hydrothermal vent metagenome TaxID=652676 RepID=A0A3B0XKM5_9ZZZZ